MQKMLLFRTSSSCFPLFILDYDSHASHLHKEGNILVGCNEEYAISYHSEVALLIFFKKLINLSLFFMLFPAAIRCS